MNVDFVELEKLNLSLWARKNKDTVAEIVCATTFLGPNATLRQRVWHLARDVLTPKTCDNPSCDTVVSWCVARNIYNTYCCVQCQVAHGNSKNKREATMLERFGVTNSFHHVEAMKKARKQKLGVEFPMQSAAIKQKTRQTCIDTYGVSTTLLLDDTRKKRNVAIEVIGGQSAVNRVISKTKKDQIDAEYWKQYYGCRSNSPDLDLVYARLSDPTWLADQHKANSLTHIAEMLQVSQPTITNAFKRHHLDVRNDRSHAQNQLVEWVRNCVPGLDVITDTRSIISPYELDIYVPSLNLAIEYNGIIWHSELWGGKSSSYHLNKTDRCAEHDIRLIHVLECEWLLAPLIVQSRLRSALGAVTTRIYARACSIVQLSNTEANQFLDRTHIQGGARGNKYSYGLLNGGNLVMVMTFGAARYDKNMQFELLRMASELDVTVVGGASKLFKHFINTHKPMSVLSYADRRWANLTSVYAQLGFKYVGVTPPSYHYFNRQSYPQLRNRQQFQKHKLEAVLEQFNPSLSEWENMKANKYDRIWDCGHTKWVWTQ